MRKGGRLGAQERTWDDGVLGSHSVAVERSQCEDILSGCFDHAGEFVGRDRRQSVTRPRQLVAGDRGGVNAHERLVLARCGLFDLFESQAIVIQSHSLHLHTS